MRALKWMVIVALAAAGCSDKTIVNNYYWSTTGGISGRVVPADPGTMVMTADSARIKPIDSNGWFVLDSLPTGLYSVIVTPPHYSQRKFRSVAVAAGGVVTLGDIALSHYPYPFYRSEPADGEDSVNVGTPITLYADEPVMLTDLLRLATITPPVSGSWFPWTLPPLDSGPTYYTLYLSGMMRVATQYTVTLPASVRTAAGVAMGDDLICRFTTEQLRVRLGRMSAGIDGGVRLLDFSPILFFNEAIDADSLAKAASFTPPVQGIWLGTSAGSSDNACVFLASGNDPLQPQTEYALTVSDSVMLGENLRLTHTETFRFTTEPAGVLRSYPENGSHMHCTLCGISLVFNAPMDTASLRTSFSLRDIATDSLVAGEFTWYSYSRQMQFSPLVGLTPGTLYNYRLERTARTLSGHSMSHDYSASFLVESSPWTVKQGAPTPDGPDPVSLSKSLVVVPR